MNYKEKVAQQIHETITQMEERLVKQVTDVVVESFKNGVEVGEQRARNGAQKPEAERSQVQKET